MEYEVLVWTKYAQGIVYRPVKEIDGEIDTLEKAQEYAEKLMLVLEDFRPSKYEIMERKSVYIKEL